MKVTIVGPYPPPFGGISVHIKRMKNYLKERNIQCDILNNSDFTNLDESIYSVKSTKEVLLKALFEKSDLIHFHTINPKMRMLLGFLKICNKKIILTIHGESFNKQLRKLNRFMRFLLVYSIKNIDKIICVNQKHVEQLCGLGIKEEKIEYIPAYLTPIDNIQDSEEINKDVWEFIAKKKILICANGWIRFHHNQDLYGFDMLIDLIKKMKDNNKDVSLLIALLGYEEQPKEERLYYESLKEKIFKLGLQDNIFIYEVKDTEFYPIIKQSDLMIRPTNVDGYGVSIAEAIYFNVPCISSDVCNRPEGTILFKSRDSVDLYNKTINVIENYQYYKNKIEGIKYDNNAEKLLSVYYEVINK